MAGSYITKRALAESLKRLMENEPLSKISIQEICDGCHLCRKSFYYHFEDKYALVNYIFDTEFIDVAKNTVYGDQWEFIEHLYKYFYENRTFYRRVLKSESRNTFFDHFRHLLQPALKEKLYAIFGPEASEFHMLFYTDAITGTLERWLLDKEPMHYADFIKLLRSLIEKGAESVCRKMNT